MAPVGPEIREQLSNELKAEVDRLDVLENLAIDAYDKPWWRHIIAVLEQRRTQFLNELVMFNSDKRIDEAMLKGRIQELTFLLTVDANCKRQAEERRNGNTE